ncbi:MAG TPA: hypothetical protein DDZ88_22245 [Verrucomicrobiales bacterium]|nr:hypothetical protein [Verrucomicrobiales bacterium]
MPNHVHVIVQPFEGIPLKEWLYSVKRFTSTRLPGAVKRAGHIWQPGSVDRVIRDAEELRRTRDYIARNPRNLSPGTFVDHQAEWLDAFMWRGILIPRRHRRGIGDEVAQRITRYIKRSSRRAKESFARVISRKLAPEEPLPMRKKPSSRSK